METVSSSLDARAVRLQRITIVWMCVECGVAITSAWRAGSPALLAFGSDSLVELLSAVVVLLQFSRRFRMTPKRAARMAGMLLVVLAIVLTAVSAAALVMKVRPDTSFLGMAVTVCALAIMPILSRAKRRLAATMENRALAADAVQSATCAYLAGITLVGLALNAALHVRWIDPVAALVAVPVLIIEARRALRGESCGCC